MKDRAEAARVVAASVQGTLIATTAFAGPNAFGRVVQALFVAPARAHRFRPPAAGCGISHLLNGDAKSAATSRDRLGPRIASPNRPLASALAQMAPLLNANLRHRFRSQRRLALSSGTLECASSDCTNWRLSESAKQLMSLEVDGMRTSAMRSTLGR